MCLAAKTLRAYVYLSEVKGAEAVGLGGALPLDHHLFVAERVEHAEHVAEGLLRRGG